MAATDTVIGILGAVVLVSVMVGVFVYEYNNVDDGDQETLDRVEFEAFYPHLDPDGDLDGDGTVNWEDGDLDGDGVLNEEDEDVAVVFTFTGTVTGAAGDVDSVSFVVHDDGASLTLSMTASGADPFGLPVDLSAQWTDGDSSATVSANGGAATTGPLAPGDHAVRIYTDSVVVEASYTLTATLTYA